MSYTNFQSSRSIEKDRECLRMSRKATLEKAEANYYKVKEKDDYEKSCGKGKWMLPSLNEKLDPKKKKKKKEKKSKTKKKSQKDLSSSSSESEDEKNWIEKIPIVTDSLEEKKNSDSQTVERDEWMSMTSLIPTVSKEEIRKKSDRQREKDLEAEKRRNLLENPGQTNRELNPYWKDGGTGLPENKKSSLELTSHAVGDQGADWLRRALRRAKEQAEDEHRSLEDVVAERWGSLKKLHSLIEEAENRERNQRIEKGRNFEKEYDRHSKYSYSSRKIYEKDSERERSERDTDTANKSWDQKRNKQNLERRQSRFLKPDDQDHDTNSKFGKSSDHRGYNLLSSSSQSSSGRKNWKKKSESEVSVNKTLHYQSSRSENKPSSSSSSDVSDTEESTKNNTGVLLTDQEMNELGAKLVKAEIMGNETLAAELKKKLQDARACRSTAQSNKVEKSSEEVVVLTKTDSKGFTHPLQQPEHPEPQQGRRRKQKMETHSDGKRIRYFADDDNWSLREMFQHEKLTSSAEMNNTFSRMVSKGVGRPGSARDMDDLFEETARLKESAGKVQARERSMAIKEDSRRSHALEGCNWCLDSKAMSKHLIIAIGNKCYLCLPPHESLTDGHCFIVPTSHITCATQLDEDVWEEMQSFRKALTTMFLKRDEDVIFFEVAVNFRYYPHMVLQCVPLPKETGDLAPIYFKKAILECEMEWATNKKLVDLSKRNVRKAVPKGLPYFFVDFGLEGGFAHVIEDEKLFPKNFAQEIIGGMLDLDHNKWRKPRKENFDTQRRKVVQFAGWWKPFDFTHGRRRKDSSSDSD